MCKLLVEHVVLSVRHKAQDVQDPNGEKFLELETPLVEAEKLVRVLRQHAPDRLATHTAAFAVAKRKDKPFLALHAVKHALYLDDKAPAAHRILVELAQWLSSRSDGGGNAAASAVLREELHLLTSALFPTAAPLA